MLASEARSSIRKIIDFAENVMKLKAVLDAVDDIEARATDRAKEHAKTVQAYEAELAAWIAKVRDAKAKATEAHEAATSEQAQYDATRTSLAASLATAQAEHDKQIIALKANMQSTIDYLRKEHDEATRATKDAKTLHAAEMAAMGAEKAKLEADLKKLREIRQTLLAQLQTGV